MVSPPQQSAGFSIMPSNPKKKMCQAFKVVVIGDSGVGKTSFLHRMADIDAPSSHVRKDYLSKVAVVKSAIAPVKVQLWDTAGQEKFGAARLPSSFFRHADAAIVVYDVTDRRSFTNVLRWVGQIQVHQVASVGNSAFSLILVGHKSDVSNAAREVHEEEGRKLCKLIGATNFFESSSKDGTNVQACFDAVAAALAEGITWPLSTVSLTRLDMKTVLGVSAAVHTRGIFRDAAPSRGLDVSPQSLNTASVAARSPTLKVLAAKSKAPTITAPYIGTLAVLLSMPMVLLWLDDDAVFRWAEAMGLQ
ncbi:Ras- protein Rab-37 [Phytophthora ramorum]